MLAGFYDGGSAETPKHASSKQSCQSALLTSSHCKVHEVWLEPETFTGMKAENRNWLVSLKQVITWHIQCDCKQKKWLIQRKRFNFLLSRTFSKIQASFCKKIRVAVVFKWSINTFLWVGLKNAKACCADSQLAAVTPHTVIASVCTCYRWTTTTTKTSECVLFGRTVNHRLYFKTMNCRRKLNSVNLSAHTSQ